MIVNDFIFALAGGFSFMWNLPGTIRQRWRECREKRIYMPLLLIIQLAFACLMVLLLIPVFLIAWYGFSHRIPWGLSQFLVWAGDAALWYLYIGIPLLILSYAWVAAISEPLWRDRTPSAYDDYTYEGVGARACGFTKRQYLEDKYAISCWIHPEYNRSSPWNEDRLKHPDMTFGEFKGKWKDDHSFRMREKEFNDTYRKLRREYIRADNS